MDSATPLIVLAICTFQRPKMLQTCLETVAKMTRPEGYQLKVVVVDNEASDSTGAIVHAVQSPFDTTYIAEPKRGIVHARNTAIDTALSLGADWIAFIDDDQTVPQSWLADMVAAQAQFGADVIHSAVRCVDESGRVLNKLKGRDETDLPDAASGGVLFSVRLVAKDQMGLRFDPRFNFAGGEDRYFFLEATQRGARICRSAANVLDELFIPSRLTKKAQFLRHFHQGWVDSYIDLDMFPRGRALRSIWTRNVSFILKWITPALIGVLVFPFKPAYGRRKFNKARTRLGRGLGGIRCLMGGQLPEQYRNTYGQ